MNYAARRRAAEQATTLLTPEITLTVRATGDITLSRQSKDGMSGLVLSMDDAYQVWVAMNELFEGMPKVIPFVPRES